MTIPITATAAATDAMTATENREEGFSFALETSSAFPMGAPHLGQKFPWGGVILYRNYRIS